MRGSFVQLVARNHEARTEVKSFVHQDARYEEIGESRTVVESFVLRGNRESRIGIHYSCNKLHATILKMFAYFYFLLVR